jgi:hypothetical protein
MSQVNLNTVSVPKIDRDNPDLRYGDIEPILWVELKKGDKPYFFNYDDKQVCESDDY